MAATIDATVGGADSNSYLTVADADGYFEARIPSTAWDDADADARTRALIQATRRLDLLRYEGEKNAQGQALKWPRILAFGDDGYELATDAIPQLIQDATCEQAYRLLVDTSKDAFADTGLEQFDRAKVGPLEVEINHSRKGSDVPDFIRKMLRPVLLGASFMLTRERS